MTYIVWLTSTSELCFSKRQSQLINVLGISEENLYQHFQTYRKLWEDLPNNSDASLKEPIFQFYGYK